MTHQFDITPEVEDFVGTPLDIELLPDVLPFYGAVTRKVPSWWRPALAAYAGLIILLVASLKYLLVSGSGLWSIFAMYGLAVSFNVGSAVVLSRKYQGYKPVLADSDLPKISVIVPAFNEERGSVETIRSILTSDYPAELMKVVVVDDGSSDGTWRAVALVASQDSRVQALRMEQNGGKRFAMAHGFNASDGAEVVVFVDSDTIIEPDALRHLVAPIVADENIHGVSGHAEVANPGASFLARMQQVRYFFAFRILKAAEAKLGKVLCASGCFSAYRKSELDEIMPMWLEQTFLGARATYGDDRALSTEVLRRSGNIVYQRNAVAWTSVPVFLRGYIKQQLRWKKSFIRESLRLISFTHHLGAFAAFRTYLGIALQFIGPIVLTVTVVIGPLLWGTQPWLYLAGIQAMATLYGIVFGIMRKESKWWPGVVYGIFSTVVMAWQIYVALFKLKDTRWGTRDASADGHNEMPGIAERVDGFGHWASPPSFERPISLDSWTSGAVAIGLTALPILIFVAFALH
jgi:hyaluronan synthase